MLNPEFAPEIGAYTRPVDVPAIGSAAPFRAFTDRDGPMLRASVLLGDTDEWHQTHDRVRLFRNGSEHFAVAEVTPSGTVHPAVAALVPWVDTVPGCAVLINLTTEQADELMGKLR